MSALSRNKAVVRQAGNTWSIWMMAKLCTNYKIIWMVVGQICIFKSCHFKRDSCNLGFEKLRRGEKREQRLVSINSNTAKDLHVELG